MDCSKSGFPVLHHLPELAQTHGHRVTDAIQPSHPLSSPSPPAFNLSQHQHLFQWVGWSFSFSINPSSEHSGLISLRIDWLDLLAVQGTLRVFSNTTVQKHQFFGTQLSFGDGSGNPLQYSCLEDPMDGGAWWAAVLGVAKSQTWLSDFTFTFHFHALEKEMATHSSVLAWRIPGTGEPGGLPSLGSHRVRHNWSDLAAAAAAFFIIRLSHPYMTTGKTIALPRWTFVGKVTSLLFNILSRLVITFLPRSKRLLISWLQSLSAVILEPKNIKSLTVSIVSPSVCHEMMGPDAMIFVFWMLSFKPTFSLSFFSIFHFHRKAL